MGLHQTAESYAKIILARLPRAGPATLQDLYGFCEALDGGSQHFVRQAVTQLAADCKIRRISAGIYGASGGAKPQAEAAVADPSDPPAAGQAAEPDADTTTLDADDHRPADATEEPPAIAATAEQPHTDEENDEMPTQTRTQTTRNGTKNGHQPKIVPVAKRVSKMDWVLAVVAETGTAKFSDLMARAKKERVFSEAGPLGSALCSAVKQKRLKKVERGVYAAPGAKVVFDASKTAKKPVVVKTARKPAKKTAAPVQKPAAKTAKPGRKPSVFRPVYDEFDRKIAKAKSDEKAAASGIGDVDAQIESLKAKRAELVAKRDGARAAGKKLDDSRKRIAGVEADVSESLKA